MTNNAEQNDIASAQDASTRSASGAARDMGPRGAAGNIGDVGGVEDMVSRGGNHPGDQRPPEEIARRQALLHDRAGRPADSLPLKVTLKAFWRMLLSFWGSKDSRKAWLLLALIISLTGGSVYLATAINSWYKTFWDTIQEYDLPGFKQQLLVFVLLATIHVLVTVYNAYLKSCLAINWRTWLTGKTMQMWLRQDNYFKLQLTDKNTDNPDQRIAEDLNLFVSSTIVLILGTATDLAMMVTFGIVLWDLSSAVDITVWGYQIHLPDGYMCYLALIYAIIGTALTFYLGKPLVRLNFRQQRYEADFRFSLIRVRENSESIALYKGEKEEGQHLDNSFASLVGNYIKLIVCTKRLGFLTLGYAQTAVIFPMLISAPLYFAKIITMGSIMQINSAFGRVQDSLSTLVSNFSSWASWKAVVDRLSLFYLSLEEMEHIQCLPVQHEAPETTASASATTSTAASATAAASTTAASSAASATAAASTTAASTAAAVCSALQLKHLSVQSPVGKTLLTDLSLVLKPGESLLIRGASGCGKSTLLKAIAGIWPYAQGEVSYCSSGSVLFLSQRPYLPQGSLLVAATYPSQVSSDPVTKQEQLAKATFFFNKLGLAHLVANLEQVDSWTHMLSLGEQQRVAIVRALLNRPAILFLDEATSAMDEQNESFVYDYLRKELPETTIISVGHRSTLLSKHDLVLSYQGHSSGDIAAATPAATPAATQAATPAAAAEASAAKASAAEAPAPASASASVSHGAYTLTTTAALLAELKTQQELRTE